MSDINERIKKLKALALRGVGGEKEQAQALLEKLTKKYCISLEDLDENKIEFFVLEYHGEIEKRLIVQITYKILNKDGCVYSRRYVKSGRKCRTKLEIECTEAQKIEIEFLFDFCTKTLHMRVDTVGIFKVRYVADLIDLIIAYGLHGHSALYIRCV